MSDATQGPGWWQASDGLWYPPDQHPDHQPPTEPVAPVPPAAPTQAMPSGPPSAWPSSAALAGPPLVPPSPGPGPVAPGPPPSGGANRGRIIAIVAVVAAIAVVAALLLANRDSGGTKVAASDSTDQSSTDQSDNTDATTTTKKKKTTTTTGKATTTTAADSGAAALTAKLLTADEMGPNLQEGSFTPDTTHDEACGQPNIDLAVPPVLAVGRIATEASTREVLEQIRAYADDAAAADAFQSGIDGLSCTSGNAFDTNGNAVPITIGPVQDITDQVNGAKKAVTVTVSGQGFEALLVAADVGDKLVSFQFEAVAGAGTETLDARLPVAQAGIDKLLS